MARENITQEFKDQLTSRVKPWPSGIMPEGEYEISESLSTLNSYSPIALRGMGECRGHLRQFTQSYNHTRIYYTGPQDQPMLTIDGSHGYLGNMTLIGSRTYKQTDGYFSNQCLQIKHSGGIGGAKLRFDRLTFEGFRDCVTAGYQEQPAGHHNDKLSFYECNFFWGTDNALVVNNSQSMGHHFHYCQFSGQRALALRAGGMITFDSCLLAGHTDLVHVQRWPRLDDTSIPWSERRKMLPWRPGPENAVIACIGYTKVDANSFSETNLENNFKLITTEYGGQHGYDIVLDMSVENLTFNRRWAAAATPSRGHIAELRGPMSLTLTGGRWFWPGCIKGEPGQTGWAKDMWPRVHLLGQQQYQPLVHDEAGNPAKPLPGDANNLVQLLDEIPQPTDPGYDDGPVVLARAEANDDRAYWDVDKDLISTEE